LKALGLFSFVLILNLFFYWLNQKASDDKIKTIDSCEYIWEAGVGFSNSPAQNYQHDYNRTEILKLLLTTFSETIYLPPLSEKTFTI
jgi:hypothetical protein